MSAIAVALLVLAGVALAGSIIVFAHLWAELRR